MGLRAKEMGALLNFASHHQCVMEHRGWAGENVRGKDMGSLLDFAPFERLSYAWCERRQSLYP